MALNFFALQDIFRASKFLKTIVWSTEKKNFDQKRFFDRKRSLVEKSFGQKRPNKMLVLKRAVPKKIGPKSSNQEYLSKKI